MFVWSGSAWVSVASEVESLAGFATQSYADNAATVASGMKLLTPTSIAVGSGSGSVSSTGTVTFSGASSVSLNDVFNATYTHYKIIIDIKNTTTSSSCNMRMRVSGADNSSSNYVNQRLTVESATVSSSRPAATTSWTNVINTSNTISDMSVLELSNAFQTDSTQLITTRMTGMNSDATAQFSTTAYGMTVTTSYTGFTLISNSSNISGTISIYGYRK
jgi:hypothetical protein